MMFFGLYKGVLFFKSLYRYLISCQVHLISRRREECLQYQMEVCCRPQGTRIDRMGAHKISKDGDGIEGQCSVGGNQGVDGLQAECGHTCIMCSLLWVPVLLKEEVRPGIMQV